MPEFLYQNPFPLGKDDTRYRLLTREYVSVSQFNGKEVLMVDPEGLDFLANQAFRVITSYSIHYTKLYDPPTPP